MYFKIVSYIALHASFFKILSLTTNREENEEEIKKKCCTPESQDLEGRMLEEDY